MRETRLKLLLIFILVSLLPTGLGAESDVAEGGIISVLVLEQYNLTGSWTGYYGDLLVSGNPITGWMLISNVTSPGNITGENMSIRCSDVSGYLLISNESTVPDLGNLMPGDLAVLDSITGTGHDSGSNTFDANTSFTIVDKTIDDVPTVWINVNSEQQDTYFREGYMTDGDAIVFVAVIEQDQVGFDGREHDFQFMLPYGPNENYYIYALFSCEWCGDGICMFGEDCKTCPEDCGECEAEMVEGEKPKTHILTPGMPIILPPPKPVINIDLIMDQDVYGPREKIGGVVIVEYTGQDTLTADLVLTLGDIDLWKEKIKVLPPYSRRRIPFRLDMQTSGGYMLKASIRNPDFEVRGKRSAEANFLITIPESERVLEINVNMPGAVVGCRVFGIDCIGIILILALMAILLCILLVKKPRREGRGPHRQLMDWMWAVKYNIRK